MITQEMTKTPKILRILIVAFIFLGCFILQGISPREAQQYIFGLGMIAMFAFLIDNLWVKLFVIWTVFLYSFFKFTMGNVYLTNVFYGAVLYLLTKKVFRKQHIQFFINGFLWFVALNVGYMVIQCCQLDFIFLATTVRRGFEIITPNDQPLGFMGQNSVMGMLMAFAVPLLAAKGTRWATIAAIGLFFPLWLSKSIVCLAAGFLGLMFVWFYRIPRRLWVLLIIAAVFGGVYYCMYIDKPDTSRFFFWKKICADAIKHPVCGYGLDSFRNQTPTKNWLYTWSVHNFDAIVQADYLDNPHNLYISLFFEWGLVGLFLFLAYIRGLFAMFAYSTKWPLTLGLMGFALTFLLGSAAHFPIFLAKLAVIIVPMFALLEIDLEPEKSVYYE